MTPCGKAWRSILLGLPSHNYTLMVNFLVDVISLLVSISKPFLPKQSFFFITTCTSCDSLLIFCCLMIQDSDSFIFVSSTRRVHGPITSNPTYGIIDYWIESGISHVVSNFESWRISFQVSEWEFRCKSYERLKWRFAFSVKDHVGPHNSIN